MSFVGSQRQTYLRLVTALQPHWRTDLRLPARIQKVFASEKRFGSRDRRLYRELLYTTVRFLPWIEPHFKTDPERAAAMVAWLAGDLPSTRHYRAELTSTWPAAPATLADKAAHLGCEPSALLPAWFAEECPAAFTPVELDTLHQRASLWLRLQTSRPEDVINELQQRGWSWRRHATQPDAIEISDEVDVTQCETYRAGLFEIQDLGSQLILATTPLTPGGHWLDACAGAGGKTLQLARLLGPQGRVTAHDIRQPALLELANRAKRAGLVNVTPTTELDPDYRYDGILVDAPCTGTGTWRRAPHLKWITTPPTVAAHAARQAELLEKFAALLRPGGVLIYATCSLNRSENEGVISSFLHQNPRFTPLPPAQTHGCPFSSEGLTLLPSINNTDGFFVASLRLT